MAKKESESLKKKLEALKRLQETSRILQEGGVQEQALQASGNDLWPSEDTHLHELIEKTKIKAPESEERKLEEEEHLAKTKKQQAGKAKNTKKASKAKAKDNRHK